MRIASCIVLFSVCATFVVAQLPGTSPSDPKDPKNTIVIRPKGSTTPTTDPAPTPSTGGGGVVYHADKSKPGFLIIKPQAGGSETFPSPKPGTEVPHLVIVRPDPMKKPEEPPVKPVLPVAKPADPDKPEKPEDGKTLLETWDIAYARGIKVGYFRCVIREYEKDGKKFVYATKEMRLQVARFGQAVETWAEDATVETSDGQILSTVARQGIGKNQMLIIRGEVDGKKLKVSIDGAVKNTKEVDWPEGVSGVSREATIVKDKKLRPGESIAYSVFDARLASVVRYTATAAKVEELVVSQGQKARKLMPVKVEMSAIDDFKLPPGLIFFDPETYEQVKMEQEMPTLGGTMTVIRSTKEAALRPAAKLLDLAEVQSIILAKEIPFAHKSKEIVYRVTLGGELPLEKAFKSDDRQHLKNADLKARSFDLHVTAVRAPVRPREPAAKPDKEYLADCYFIDWNNDLVKKHAKDAIKDLPANASDWDKARAIEKWVNVNMKATEFSQAMATCANVAKNLTGDCTEYSVLAAGLCRANGIPARTAIGLVYAPPSGQAPKPTLAWHMWFEVWIEGHWVALDAVMGQGSVGPAHLKVTDSHWADEKSFKPLLPLISLLGTSPKVEVVKQTD